ncbi:uncharacterized protein LOC131951963 [Physella acuta]|uniref:uncharacterized protein LOC131951963 n=1 Tax=Physella acuta TaxID=109671 RepID=UPI0027DCEC9A|nr:uncharacterized protein LOC131951963 [Physella acuta]
MTRRRTKGAAAVAARHLDWTPKWALLIYFLVSARQCVLMGEMMYDEPGCLFPEYLQSTDPGYGDWTWKYSGSVHVGRVQGGMYVICSSKETDEESCPDKRICVRQHGPDVFVVKHGEDGFRYQCIHFISRSPTVIQLELSDTIENVTAVCSRNMTLDHSPWISVRYYKQAVGNCPFSGGYNFHEIHEFTKTHILHRNNSQCMRHPHRADAPVRVESDCVEREGMYLHFGNRNCIPHDSYFTQSQRLVCMAWWERDGYGFVLLRKEHDRAFYCMRVGFRKFEVTHITLFLDWECYRVTDLSDPGGRNRLPYSTAYVIFNNSQKKIITNVCDKDFKDCSFHRGPCHDGTCYRSCHQCLNQTGAACEFDKDVRHTWTLRGPYGATSNMTIHQNSLRHPSLGLLQCVTFDPRYKVALRAILWGTYQNGCYPRFLCMYYDTPSAHIMRYRLSNIQQWPLTLTDEGICNETNFVIQPDFNDPKDRYKDKPWDVAVKSRGHLKRMSCIFPSELPTSASFVDQYNKSGCLIFKSEATPKSITLVSLPPATDLELPVPDYDDATYQLEYFHCVAAMTYINSFKSVITVTADNTSEVLCWMIKDHSTLIVVSTSSCNKETAEGILRGEERYLPHLKWRLDLNTAGPEVSARCTKIYDHNENRWKEKLIEKIEHIVHSTVNIRNCGTVLSSPVLVICFLFMLLT